jgi:hypothetical protein
MKPDISEFSYGYALTEAFIFDANLPVVGAPIFPSLIEEGRSGGYDVGIQFQGLLLFLQFKLSHFMTRGTADETKRGLLDIPFYRMHLRPARHSRQHDMLLDLEATGEIALYAAPKFHLPAELNTAYLTRTMIQQSLFIRPSAIGPLPDDRDHHVSFRDGYPIYFCSEPKKIRGEENSETALKELHDIIQHNEYKKYDSAVLNEIADQMLSIILRHQISLRRATFSPEYSHKLKDMKPIEKLRYLSRTYFDCEPILMKPRQTEV